MTQTTFRATRAVPIREQKPSTYQCRRCGIERGKESPTINRTHCKDCLPWVEDGAEP